MPEWTSPERGASGGTVAFLFSDIEGSTRLEQEHGTAAYAALRERHRELLRAAFTAEGGEEQGTEGDSFFVVFPTARAAVAAAAAAQRAVQAEPWPDGAEIRVRMGIHAGEALAVGGSLVGIDINRAARIAGSANGGQVLVSEVVRSLATPTPDGVSFLDLGAHRLKDLREPERIQQLVVDGLRSEFPPIRSLDARPNNLPTQLTSFVGREAELAEACRLLGANRLVTLTGPGGTGKTRLSLQVAAEAASDFPDGVFFVALETVRDRDLVLSRIATAVGLAEMGNRSARDLLVEWLASRRVLIVLDNFEQVLDAGPIVADLLRAVSDVSVLVTSRAPLRVSGEQEYPVPGLPTPPDPSKLSAVERANLPVHARSLDPASLSTYEAVRLFVSRATAVRPGFELTNENAPAVAAICARLHGMPLAIELAAARVRLLPPEAILLRLDHQLGALAAGSRDLPDRQKTLRGAIAWSYDLLDPDLRRLLARLSVFQGGFDLEACSAVCASDDLGIDVVDGVEALADQSLIRAIEGGEVRFGLLETIREFAAEMLETDGEAEVVRDRHAAWFLAFARRISPELAGSEQRRWLERLETEHDNVRAVLDRAVEREDAETAVGLAFAIWRFWQKRGHLLEARRRLDAMAAAPWSRTVPVLRARLLEALGGVCWWQADIAGMRAPYEEAVTLWRSIGDRSELANALYNFAFCFSAPGGEPGSSSDPEGLGLAALEEALAIYRELGDERGEANVLWGVGNRRYFALAEDGGIPEFEASLEIFRRVGDRTMEAWSLHMAGSARLRLGRLGEARDDLVHALRHFRDSGDAAGITLALDDLASLAAAEGDATRAARLWGAARSLTSSTGTGLAGFVDEFFVQQAMPSVRSMLDREELERLAREGAAMTLEEAVAYALEVGQEKPLARPGAPA